MQSANEIHPGTTSVSPLPEWHKMYFTALREVDDSRALIEIGRASMAIEDRLRKLEFGGPEYADEIQDLNSAQIYLGLLLQNMDIQSGRLPWH